MKAMREKRLAAESKVEEPLGELWPLTNQLPLFNADVIRALRHNSVCNNQPRQSGRSTTLLAWIALVNIKPCFIAVHDKSHAASLQKLWLRHFRNFYNPPEAIWKDIGFGSLTEGILFTDGVDVSQWRMPPGVVFSGGIGKP